MALHKIQPFQSVSHQILPQIDFYSSVSSKRTLAMNGKRVGPEKKKLSNMLFNRNYFIEHFRLITIEALYLICNLFLFVGAIKMA